MAYAKCGMAGRGTWEMEIHKKNIILTDLQEDDRLVGFLKIYFAITLFKNKQQLIENILYKMVSLTLDTSLSLLFSWSQAY